MYDLGTSQQHYVTATAEIQPAVIYRLLTRFEDYPKYFSFVDTVIRTGKHQTHWEAHVFGKQQWEAAEHDWIENVQVGWRVTAGWGVSGRIRVQDIRSMKHIRVHMFVTYTPHGGLLGDLVDEMLVGPQLKHRLGNDLRTFCQMLETAPAEALDPDSPVFLFREGESGARERESARQGRAWALN